MKTVLWQKNQKAHDVCSGRAHNLSCYLGFWDADRIIRLGHRGEHWWSLYVARTTASLQITSLASIYKNRTLCLFDRFPVRMLNGQYADRLDWQPCHTAKWRLAVWLGSALRLHTAIFGSRYSDRSTLKPDWLHLRMRRYGPVTVQCTDCVVFQVNILSCLLNAVIDVDSVDLFKYRLTIFWCSTSYMITLSTLPLLKIDLSMTLEVIEKL